MFRKLGRKAKKLFSTTTASSAAPETSGGDRATRSSAKKQKVDGPRSSSPDPPAHDDFVPQPVDDIPGGVRMHFINRDPYLPAAFVVGSHVRVPNGLQEKGIVTRIIVLVWPACSPEFNKNYFYYAKEHLKIPKGPNALMESLGMWSFLQTHCILSLGRAWGAASGRHRVLEDSIGFNRSRRRPL